MGTVQKMILSTPSDLIILPQSVTSDAEAEYGLAYAGTETQLLVLSANSTLLQQFEGITSLVGDQSLLVGPTNAHNIAALRQRLTWLNPRPLGLQTSAGFGDRLGIATPGHIRALRAVGGQIAPIFTQQSIREMTRTGRSAQQVMDDATWGVFAESWQSGFGADADHLKTPADIDTCAACGYTFYTFDPGEHVDNNADTATLDRLKAEFVRLPWDQLEDDGDSLVERYADKLFDVEGHKIDFDIHAVYKAAVKYGRAVAHIVKMYRHLTNVSKSYEVEISVDETETPTTHAEHLFMVSEFKRLGVQWISLAPRFIGRFEKGVDYIGDVDALEKDIAIHAAIARVYGPYKISLHSGSDKFSIYAPAMRQTHGLVHLKTAGTSWLEALRTIAHVDPALFREIYVFAREHYETDKASYHVSASLDKAPKAEIVTDAQLVDLLDQFDVRQIVHVTFGSVLKNPDFYARLMQDLRSNPDAYAADLTKHFVRHLAPFVSQ
ncbi:MAG: tagaturonate epimerase family protein [Chloroflexota bacterium]